MKAAFMEGPERFVIRDVPDPVPSKGEVVIKVHACAVCGSDLTVYKMGIPDRILGHEFAGIIAETGPGIQNWKPGNRVAVEPLLICGECHWCRTGRYNLCEGLQYTGLATDGGFAEYVSVPSYQLRALPDNVPFEHGAVIEPLAVAFRGVRRAGIEPGDTVAVFGCGAVGLFSILWAKAHEAGTIIAADIAPERLKAAQRLTDFTFNPSECDSADEILRNTGGLGADVVLECSGNSHAQTSAVDSVRKGGTIMLLGIGYEPVPLPLMQVTMREIDIRGSLGYLSLRDTGEFNRSLTAVSSGGIDLSKIPFGTYSLNETGKAFADSLTGKTAKALVIM
jgi:threonine dehydrogenase-like Zn-dependent dehydrogenase